MQPAQADSNLGDQLHDTLSRVFRHPAFRAGQHDIISSVLRGRATLGVLPTGGGKSLCYQLPGFVLGGLSVVVSPLIALMRDQVYSMRNLGVRAAALHSGQDPVEARIAKDIVQDGEGFLFVSPERLAGTAFRAELASGRVSLLAIDEAHCVVEWGHVFRPEYARLGMWIRALDPRYRLALTATAAPPVQQRLLASLGWDDAAIHVGGFDRSNIRLEVHRLAYESERFDTLCRALRSWAPGIVYTSTRRQAELLALRLGAQGVSSAPYHAGLDPTVRHRIQERFMSGALPCVVATNAFGMGIDKGDVRLVAHAGLPRSVDAYYQEIGRAGRDGGRALALMLWTGADSVLLDTMQQRSRPRAELALHLWKTLSERGPQTVAQLAVPGPDGGAQAVGVALQWLHKSAFIAGLPRGVWRIDPGRTAESLRACVAALDERYDWEDARFRAVMRFVDTRTCRRRILLEALGDRAPPSCQGCDVCCDPWVRPVRRMVADRATSRARTRRSA